MIERPGKSPLYARALLFSLFLFQFLTSFRPQELAWDGVYYYATARSIIFDRDLHLQNDMRLAYTITPAYDFAATHPENHLTATGRVHNPFAVGTSILWLPWMGLVYALCKAAALLGLGPATLTGYEWPFLWGIATATCLYGWSGLLIAYHLARRLTGEKAALLAAATAALATPLWYYQFREPFYAHPLSAMATALFVLAWWTQGNEPHRPVHGFLLGGLGGLAILVRWQNATYLILPCLTTGAAAVRAWRKGDHPTLRRSWINLLTTLLGATLVATPQLAVWIVVYGRPFVVPQGGGFITGVPRWLPQVVLSPFHGLIPWMPLVVPALAGLVLLSRRAPLRGFPLLLAFLLQVIVNSSIADWFGGGGYGARRFSNTLVLLVVGYAYAIDRGGKRWRAPALALSGLIVLHQLLLIRYGFPDRIGGTVVSMAPDYAWRADSGIDFLRQLAGYVPRALRHPLETLTLPRSPLAGIRTAPGAAARQLLMLLGGSSLIPLTEIARRRLDRAPYRRLAPFLLAGATVILVLAADAWILGWS